MDVILRAFDGIVHHRAGLHDKRPIRALREQELPAGLGERAQDHTVSLAKPACQLLHPPRSVMQMAIDPIVGAIQPHFVITAGSHEEPHGVQTWLTSCRSRYSAGVIGSTK